MNELLEKMEKVLEEWNRDDGEKLSPRKKAEREAWAKGFGYALDMVKEASEERE